MGLGIQSPPENGFMEPKILCWEGDEKFPIIIWQSDWIPIGYGISIYQFCCKKTIIHVGKSSYVTCWSVHLPISNQLYWFGWLFMVNVGRCTRHGSHNNENTSALSQSLKSHLQWFHFSMLDYPSSPSPKLTVRPQKKAFPEEKDRLPTTIFQGLLVKGLSVHPHVQKTNKRNLQGGPLRSI